MRYLVVGCGLSGGVVARELAERGEDVTIWDRRDHIGGNMYDCRDPESGYLVQMYGPHTFHTSDKSLYDYMCRFSEWDGYILRCGAVWDGEYTPTPFNFTRKPACSKQNTASRAPMPTTSGTRPVSCGIVAR